MRKDRCLTQAVMINGQDKMTYTTVQYYSYNLSTLSKGIPAIMKIEPQLLLGMITTKRNIQKYTELIEYTPFYHCSRNLLEAMLSNNNQQTHNHQRFPFGNWVTFLWKHYYQLFCTFLLTQNISYLGILQYIISRQCIFGVAELLKNCLLRLLLFCILQRLAGLGRFDILEFLTYSYVLLFFFIHVLCSLMIQHFCRQPNQRISHLYLTVCELAFNI